MDRVLQNVISRSLIKSKDGKLYLSEKRKCYVRRFLIIDVIAISGAVVKSDCSAKILVPGYGPYYGLSVDDVSNKIDEFAKGFEYSRSEFAEDLTWLAEKKYTVMV